jgi:hypothetical protein
LTSSSPRPPERDYVTRPDASGSPQRQRSTVERRREIGTSDGHDGFFKYLELKPEQEDLYACIARAAPDQISLTRLVADQQIADAEGKAAPEGGTPVAR